VRAAVARGHDVTAACRGSSTVPEGARHVRLDRTGDDPGAVPELAGAEVVVDVATTPSWVRRAVAALPEAHWVYVSSVSAYADHATPSSGAGRLPLLRAVHEDRDVYEAPEVYGGMKVACEQTVQDGAASSYVVRPGLVVGPGDPSGRFTYWPVRLARTLDRPGPVLAPGDPADPSQVVDVRDLASWIVEAAELRRTGVVDGVGAVHPRADLLAAIARGVGADPDWVWVGSDRLTELGVRPWMGEGSIPLWLPPEEYAGMLAHDPGPAAEAGLVVRPIEETARDTLAWWRAEDGALTGLTAEEEADLLSRA
jgi:nucleoside-diphosphate-sugar epimerase